MTTWFIFPAADETAFRAAYDAEVATESVGVAAANQDGTLRFVGSSRITESQRDAVLAAVPSAEAHESWPPPAGWDYPED